MKNQINMNLMTLIIALNCAAPIVAMDNKITPIHEISTAHYPQHNPELPKARSMHTEQPATTNGNNARRYAKLAQLPCTLACDSVSLVVPVLATLGWCLVCCDTQNCEVFPGDYDNASLPEQACRNFGTCPTTRRLVQSIQNNRQ